ncbi:hypothetical protein QQF64_027895 [Cirrhinus molitorella]|uniref:Uncharacterized protein n=1 Tax=Cirrhinus molitorella TaxID=172907 RepID=A0ABR3NDP1_9TELE
MKRWDFGHSTSVAAFKILHQRNVRPDLISALIRGQRPLGGAFWTEGQNGVRVARQREIHGPGRPPTVSYPVSVEGREKRRHRRERKTRSVRGRADGSEIMEHLCPVSIHSALSLSLSHADYFLV